MGTRHFAWYAVAVGALLSPTLLFVDGCDVSVPGPITFDTNSCNPAGGYCAGLGLCAAAYRVDYSHVCPGLLGGCCMPRDCADAGGACIPSSSCTSGNTSTFQCAVKGDVCCFPSDDASSVLADAQLGDAAPDAPDAVVDAGSTEAALDVALDASPDGSPEASPDGGAGSD